jgi:hypothetical protein
MMSWLAGGRARWLRDTVLGTAILGCGTSHGQADPMQDGTLVKRTLFRSYAPQGRTTMTKRTTVERVVLCAYTVR